MENNRTKPCETSTIGDSRERMLEKDPSRDTLSRTRACVLVHGRGDRGDRDITKRLCARIDTSDTLPT
jgi:hypothetical protein